MPNLFSILRECFGFSQIIKSALFIVSIARSEMSFKFPIGVATINKPKLLLSIYILFILLISCTPINLSKETEQTNIYKIDKEEKATIKQKEDTNIIQDGSIGSTTTKADNIKLQKKITLLLSTQDKNNITNQFINVLELAVFNKSLKNVIIEIEFFENENELENIILKTKQKGKIYIGPIETTNTKIVKNFCDDSLIFFSFSSKESLAGNCIYLLNFFPKNELKQLFKFLDKDSKVALLYPENNYGYMINSLIDNIANESNAVIINRSSYKNDLSNVRDAIKELGKYELRKYELDRQKQILKTKNDDKSKARLIKLKKFKTTTDYDFTHILIADYGLNLLQVAPLLPYYDIDPNVVQFLGTGVIDDENFFYEPSLQGSIFPGIEKNKRIKLVNQYQQVHDDKLLRISTLPYDLIGLLNLVFTEDMTLAELIELLNNSKVKFDGVDGEFYFKNNMIERNLDILKISNGSAKKIN